MRTRRIGFGAVVALLFALPAATQAQELTMRHGPRAMQGMRPLAMGGAFSAVTGSDENALFYNPAAINDLPDDKVRFQFLLPSVEMSYKAIPFLATDVKNLASDIDDAGTDSAKIGVFDDFTATHTGRYEEAGIRGSIVNVMHKKVAAALTYENRTLIALTNPASATIDIEALTQGGLTVGSAYPFFDGLLQAGMALKLLERHLIDTQVTQGDVIANDDFGDILDMNNFGFGAGLDVGLKGKIPLKWSVWEYLDPSFALAVQDVGNTRFTGSVGYIPESTTFGFALFPNYWKLKSILAVDFRDLDQRTDFLHKVHAGYEIAWPEISKILRTVSIRFGANQGYLAGGLGLDFKYAKLNVATWGREIGRFSRQKDSRMFGAQLAAGF